jgi:succinate dehydrogenase / fumarate reductase iron-sulfur subunit
VTDVSWNYRVNKNIPPFKPRPRDPDGTWRMSQAEVDRVQEFRKCIECFLCQDVCHVRDHEQKDSFAGPRFFVRIAASRCIHRCRLRTAYLKEQGGIGLCNITSAAPRSVPSRFTSPTTPSFR